MSSDILRSLFLLGDQHFISTPEQSHSGGIIPPIHQNTIDAGLDCSFMTPDTETSVSSPDSGRDLTISFESSSFCGAADLASNNTPPPTYVNSSSVIPSDWELFDSSNNFLSECS